LLGRRPIRLAGALARIVVRAHRAFRLTLVPLLASLWVSAGLVLGATFLGTGIGITNWIARGSTLHGFASGLAVVAGLRLTGLCLVALTRLAWLRLACWRWRTLA